VTKANDFVLNVESSIIEQESKLAPSPFAEHPPRWSSEHERREENLTAPEESQRETVESGKKVYKKKERKSRLISRPKKNAVFDSRSEMGRKCKALGLLAMCEDIIDDFKEKNPARFRQLEKAGFKKGFVQSRSAEDIAPPN
jgi:hypothetical protein